MTVPGMWGLVRAKHLAKGEDDLSQVPIPGNYRGEWVVPRPERIQVILQNTLVSVCPRDIITITEHPLLWKQQHKV